MGRMAGGPQAGRDAAALAAQLLRVSRVLSARVDQPAEPAPSEPVPPGAFEALVASHDLSPFEADVLLLAVGATVDADFARLLAAAGGARRNAPTVSGALTVLLEDRGARLRARPLLGAEGALVRMALLRRRPDDSGDHELVATRRAVAAALGRHPLDDLPTWARQSRTPADDTRSFWTELDPRAVARGLRAPSPPGALCLVRGASGSGRSTWASIAAGALGPQALAIDVPRALAEAESPAEVIAELCEDAALVGVPVILDDADKALALGAATVAALLDVLERVPLSAIAVVSDATPVDSRVIRRAIYQARIGPPPPAVRTRLWGADARRRGLGVVASELVLTPAQIANARRLMAGGIDPLDAALSQIEGGELLETQEDRPTLDDLVVGDDVLAELRELITAIRVRGAMAHRRTRRGRGISALFDGDSGTGKTMACDVVAAEVNLPLTRVNVSALVDKYIGETEKNLTRVFAQARARGGILLFDEADALFATRTAVGRAADRYANLETNLLLQLLEEHPGIVLLTTNLKGNLDQAFLRRLTYKVSFPCPDAPLRETLWRLHLPPDHAAEIDGLTRLASAFELSGGGIKNAVARACYRAAGAERPVGLGDLADCAQLETAATGKVAAW
jgi:ATPase family associated with various cellular activities (AAA)